MIRRPSVRVTCLAALAAGAIVAAGYPLVAQVTAARADDAAKPADGDKKEPAEVAAIRQTNQEYGKAFARGDAKALAALWTESGEFDGIDADPIRGRAALEATYAKFFKDNPKATVEPHVESIRLLGLRAAVEEGTLHSGIAGQKKAGQETHFSAFLVLEDKGWRYASVREWEEEPAEPVVSLQDLAWLAGDWSANAGKDGEARLTYTLDDNKAFLRSRYSVVQDGKVIRSGTQVIGKDPNAGLHSWQFESDGGFGESTWSRAGNHWVIEGTATLPDGSEETASHMLVPVDKDNFVWHMTGRTAGGVEEPGRPPVKVQRVRAGK
jgi:uncharacterized protein (TIGR02246 family)